MLMSKLSFLLLLQILATSVGLITRPIPFSLQNHRLSIQRTLSDEHHGSERPSTRCYGVRHKYIAINGGDLWSGFDCTEEELEELATSATSMSVEKPIMQQFYASRSWLWRQWIGTMIWSTRRAVLLNSLFAVVLAVIFNHGSLQPSMSWTDQLSGVERLWRTSSGLVTFVLSFFLNQGSSFPFSKKFSVKKFSSSPPLSIRCLEEVLQYFSQSSRSTE